MPSPNLRTVPDTTCFRAASFADRAEIFAGAELQKNAAMMSSNRLEMAGVVLIPEGKSRAK